ncbi:MAG TPA: 5-formyltetrahydrofolate cyclo-ligase [Marinagarivorans sp.]
MQNTASLRQRIKQQRLALSQAQQQIAAQKLALRIARHPLFRQATNIAAYCASGGEISLAPLIKIALSVGKQCFLPVLDGQNLRFCAYNASTKMKQNRYGLWEPYFAEATSVTQLDLVLCPLVAFDKTGNRIGMGGGFYDRALANRRQNQTRAWGVAHALQEEDELETQWWDVKLDCIFTDRAVHCAQFA